MIEAVNARLPELFSDLAGDIVTDNWSLFEEVLARGKGSKAARTKWIVEVNDLRKPVTHASKGQGLPITEEQLAFLEEIETWLRGQVAAPGAGDE